MEAKKITEDSFDKPLAPSAPMQGQSRTLIVDAYRDAVTQTSDCLSGASDAAATPHTSSQAETPDYHDRNIDNGDLLRGLKMALNDVVDQTRPELRRLDPEQDGAPIAPFPGGPPGSRVPE